MTPWVEMRFHDARGHYWSAFVGFEGHDLDMVAKAIRYIEIGYRAGTGFKSCWMQVMSSRPPEGHMYPSFLLPSDTLKFITYATRSSS